MLVVETIAKSQSRWAPIPTSNSCSLVQSVIIIPRAKTVVQASEGFRVSMQTSR